MGWVFGLGIPQMAFCGLNAPPPNSSVTSWSEEEWGPRGHGGRTGLRLVSAITLASSWDCGPADFTSWRFCSRICRRDAEREDGKTRTCRPWDPLWDPASGVTQMAPHLVPHLQHLLRVGVEGHKLVGVLDADGGATAALLHLISLQPLRGAEGGDPQRCVAWRANPNERTAWREETPTVAHNQEQAPANAWHRGRKPREVHGMERGKHNMCMAWRKETPTNACPQEETLINAWQPQ